MTLRTLIRRSLRYHWRAHLGVVLGAAVGSAALIGAQVVGDSVKGSLRERSLAGLGHGSFLLFSGDRLFSEVLPMRFRRQANSEAIASAYRRYASNSTGTSVILNPEKPERCMLLFHGAVVRADGGARANRVQVIGVSDFAPVLFPAPETVGPDARRPVALTNRAVVNAPLAETLGLDAGEVIVIRFPKLSSLSPDVAISSRDEQTTTLRIPVEHVTADSELAGYSPTPAMGMPASVFVPLGQLARAAGLPQLEASNPINTWLAPEIVELETSHLARQGKFIALVNRVLAWIGERLRRPKEWDGAKLLPLPVPDQLAKLSALLATSWTFESIQIGELRPNSSGVALVSPRVFLDPPVVRAARTVGTNTQPLLTYLANLLQSGTNTTPYSMVTAAGPPWTPADMRDDEILVNQWLADDLQVKPGDEIALSYFDPESGASLIEHTNNLRVRGIVPMEMPWADRTLMPDFPGIEKTESTRDWDAGFPLTYEIRQKDEDYWKQYRGTPKAFITLAAGQKMWANRFGNLTAIRFPIPTNETSILSSSGSSQREEAQTTPADERQSLLTSAATVEKHRALLEKKILATLKPEELGLRFEPVREQALRAAEQSQDFGGLFLGFSFFLIAAALLLMALLFQLGLEQRAPEIGTLLALGFTHKRVRRLLLGEGVALALIGGVVGALAGLGYAKAMLHGLATIWQDAVGATALSFHVTGQTLVVGLFAAVAVSAVTIWLTLRKFVRRAPRELLAGEVQSQEANVQGRKSKVVAVGALAAAVGLAGWTVARGDTANAGAFFGAGALVLVAGLSFVSAWLAGMARQPPARRLTPSSPANGAGREAGAPITLGALGLRGCARRRKRSLSTVAMLACGSFLIVSIGVFRLEANRDATQRSSGTGGFALIGETTMPVVQDLNARSGRDFFALREDDLTGVSFVPFRVREGDEASCLNLNRAQKPRLLGVKPELLEGRFSFAKRSGWEALKSAVRSPESEAPEINAIGDANSIQWAMGKKVGDTLDYVDERGQPFKVRIVGAVANSILQGQLLIDESEFVKRFPGESGFRMFLIDSPTNRVTEVSATLSRAMQDTGLELTPTAQRLARFNAVQNTYLGTFQVLGGLGLLLGSVGLGIVVLRNVLERRGELAVLLAVGFRKSKLQGLLLIENGALLSLGLAIGVVAAALAVLPTALSPGAQLPVASLVLTLGAVLLNGALWNWAATRIAVRGDLLTALRDE